MTKRVCIINTGGTIAMAPSADGFRPQPGFLAEQVERFPEFAEDGMPHITVVEREPLIDSANLTPSDWLGVAEQVVELHDDYDGFVVAHGTDTMAYTASALSFILRDLDVPVVLTGSQIPLVRARSDGRDNLIAAVQVAASCEIPEVTLVFGRSVLRGNRSTKVDSAGLDAFASPNLPELARIGIDLRVNRELVRQPSPGSALRPRHVEHVPVIALRLFPGLTGATLDRVLQQPLRGVVLETYGAGNGPSADGEFLRAIERATENGVVIVNVTQCVSGGVAPDTYATGHALTKAGALPGTDMTTEAALTKLSVLLGSGCDVEDVRASMLDDLAGELTPSAARTSF